MWVYWGTAGHESEIETSGPFQHESLRATKIINLDDLATHKVM